MVTTAEQREQAIANSLKVYKKEKKTRRHDISHRGEQISVPVVRLNTSVLLLNHDNNRLSAQLDGHPQQEVVQTSPTSQEAQEIIQRLLASTKDFNALKEQLRDLRQQKPGLATREGLLIDGNTRLAALIQLNKEGGDDGIDVAILPADVTQQDLLDIETNQQMQQLVHQNYSFTNQLLMTKKNQR